MLASSYRRSLDVAAERGWRTVAFPSISTGVYGYPADAAARAVAAAAGRSSLILEREPTRFRVRCRVPGLRVVWLRVSLRPFHAQPEWAIGNDDLRFVEFAGSRDGRPRTLTAEDLPAITGGTHYFARKFDPRRDARVLEAGDRIDLRPVPARPATGPAADLEAVGFENVRLESRDVHYVEQKTGKRHWAPLAAYLGFRIVYASGRTWRPATRPTPRARVPRQSSPASAG